MNGWRGPRRGCPRLEIAGALTAQACQRGLAESQRTGVEACVRYREHYRVHQAHDQDKYDLTA
jgi:hypothetical protein